MSAAELPGWCVTTAAAGAFEPAGPLEPPNAACRAASNSSRVGGDAVWAKGSCELGAVSEPSVWTTCRGPLAPPWALGVAPADAAGELLAPGALGRSPPPDGCAINGAPQETQNLLDAWFVAPQRSHCIVDPVGGGLASPDATGTPAEHSPSVPFEGNTTSAAGQKKPDRCARRGRGGSRAEAQPLSGP